ncbi:hypothetical protein BDV12DRAFT_171620 [Aspergillus spectabilis]
MFLSHGADVNAVTVLGDALQAAAMKGNLSIIHTLIQHNARVGNLGGFFGTVLQAAVYRGHQDVAVVLLNAGGAYRAVGAVQRRIPSRSRGRSSETGRTFS